MPTYRSNAFSVTVPSASQPGEWVGKTAHYVRAGATGSNNGSDWTNAYTALPATLTRDHVYYVADGSYSGYTFNDAVSGTLKIYVVKATASDHGTETGWSSAYGDGQATFTNNGSNVFTITTGYWHIDGVVGGGPDVWSTGSDDTGSTYGFKVFDNTLGTVKLVEISGSPTSLTFRHIDLSFDASDALTFPSPAATGAQDAFRQASGTLTDFTVGYCRFNSCGRVALLTRNTLTNAVIEYCYFRDVTIGTHAGMHGELWSCGNNGGDSSSITIRYNYINTDRGSGSTGGFLIAGTDGLYVYGNVFVDCGLNNGIVTNWTADPHTTSVFIHHNTFVSCNVRLGFSSMTDVTSYNNLIYDSTFTWWQGTHDYSASEISLSESNQQTLLSDPLANSASRPVNARLIGATTAGTTLAATYNTDMDGVSRTTPDRGAFEYN